MKNWDHGTTGDEGCRDSGWVEAVVLFDLERARSARIIGRRESPQGAMIACDPAWDYF